MSPSPARYRYAVDFAVDGDIRFLAHNDMVRLFGRACARAGLPVCFTEGFNPRMRLSLPFPRPVGQGSQVERMLVDLREDLEANDLLERLRPQTPSGVALQQAMALAPTDNCQPQWARYRVECDPADADTLAHHAQTLLASETVEITRVRHKDGRSKTVNIRPFIDTINVASAALDVSLSITSSGSVTPAEVCAALGMKADEINHLIRRVEIRWHESQPKQPMIPSPPSIP